MPSARGQVIGTAEDLDVSASTVPPFERPNLGPWLAEPGCHEWDALVFWRADRAVRSMADMFALTRWAQEHQKVIVFVSGPFGGDPLTLDMRHTRTDPHVNLILAIIAFAAEVETQAIKERVNNARAFLLPTDRWVAHRATGICWPTIECGVRPLCAMTTRPR
jgi:DNA invertase Pin-like site-specific DNA recombinase